MSKIQLSQLDVLATQLSTQRAPGESDSELSERLMNTYQRGIFRSGFETWLDGAEYPLKEKVLFGRAAERYHGWGEMRRQKKAPHTEVLYVYCLQMEDRRTPGTGEPYKAGTLVLRSLSNCSNDQLQDAIKLAALRLEQGRITQAEAEMLLDRCYAEMKRRMDWTEREKEKRRGKHQGDQDKAPVDAST